MGTNGAAGCYVLTKSVTYAQALLRVLRARGMQARMIRTPRSITENGCAHAVLVRRTTPDAILRAMSEAGMPRFRLYTTENGTDFREFFG